MARCLRVFEQKLREGNLMAQDVLELWHQFMHIIEVQKYNSAANGGRAEVAVG